jgi:NADPH-dependent 2,4-dienoyl-CoA reductase/sulfur reductase-like enzyme
MVHARARRLDGNGFERTGKRIAFTFEGKVVDAFEGETIAAALAAAGVLDLRHTKDGGLRGPFCGMGVCFECLVRLDGTDGVRACMQKVSDGDLVERQPAVGVVDATPVTAPARQSEVISPEVLVVGGGPAGLFAALGARKAGAQVTLVDERTALGGQYYKQPSEALRFARSARPDEQYSEGQNLIRRVAEAGIDLVSDCAVWGAFLPREVAAVANHRNLVFRPQRLVLATGAYERGVPFPGWTSPGVMTTGAGQTFLRAHRVAPGGRFLIAGNGPLNLQLAAELLAAGVEVVAVIEAATAPGLDHIADIGRMLWSDLALVREGARILARLRRARVPVLYGHVIVEAGGVSRISQATVAPIQPNGFVDKARTRTFEVDTVCLGYGFRPNSEIARLLGCDEAHHALSDTPPPFRRSDDWTIREGVYLVGDAAGLGGARAAAAEGFLAGVSAARSLGHQIPTTVAAEEAQARARRFRALRFQRGLWRVFAAPRISHLCDDNTVVCRCENVTYGVLTSLLSRPLEIGSIKRRSRAGMGQCQGRYCAAVIESIRGARPDSKQPFGWAPRPPVKPVLLADIAEEQ